MAKQLTVEPRRNAHVPPKALGKGLRSQKPYLSAQEGRFLLYKGDSLSILDEIPSESIDMVFADPPYFLSNDGITCHAGKMVSVNKGRWDRSQGPEQNHTFNKMWLGKCQRVLAKNGTIWISGTSHIIFSIGFALQSLGYKILNDIIWYKRNAPPNLSCRYFTHSTETVIWAAKSPSSKHKFNYQLMRNLAQGRQMRNLWQIVAPGRQEKIYGKHPTQKPLELLRRIVLASTDPGDLVLDPFNGSGTTGLAALQLGRHYIGIEIEERFLELTAKRFTHLQSSPGLFVPF